MTKKLFISSILIAFLSGNLLSESIEEIIVLEKKLSSLNGWSNNQSITSINEIYAITHSNRHEASNSCK